VRHTEPLKGRVAAPTSVTVDNSLAGHDCPVDKTFPEPGREPFNPEPDELEAEWGRTCF
jgi:hypothetical protein